MNIIVIDSVKLFYEGVFWTVKEYIEKSKELNICTRSNNVIFKLDNCDLILSGRKHQEMNKLTNQSNWKLHF